MKSKIIVLFLVLIFFINFSSVIAIDSIVGVSGTNGLTHQISNLENIVKNIHKIEKNNVKYFQLLSKQNEQYAFNDSIGDVFDEEYEPHPEVKDIDMDLIFYNRTGRNLTIDILMVDKLIKFEEIELVIVLYLYTTEEEYSVLYLYSSPFEDITGSTLEGDLIDVEISGFNSKTITISFHLINETEFFQDLIVCIAKADIQQTYAYTDIYPNDEFLDVEAQGDTEGQVGESLNYFGFADDGTPPYIFIWDFDDGEFSEEQNTTHTFKKAGTYDVVLYVIDALGIDGVDFLIVTIYGDVTPPNIKITKPEKGLYIFNKKILPRFIRCTKVIGSVTIEVEATDEESGIKHVDFYVNGKYLGNDTSYPYNFNWSWTRPRFFHWFILKAVAYDNEGNRAADQMLVRKFL